MQIFVVFKVDLILVYFWIDIFSKIFAVFFMINFNLLH